MKDTFAKSEVAIRLTGEEWVALLALALRQELSPKGKAVSVQATRKFGEQLLKVQKEMQP